MTTSPALLRQIDGGTIGHGPPDPSIAVGLEAIVTIEHFKVRWYDRDGKLLGDIPTTSILSGSFGADPRLVYDAVNDRFLVTALPSSGGGPVTIPLAVSRTGNPADGWYFGTISTNLASTEHLDYPSVATDGRAVYIQSNVFGGSNFAGARLWIVEDGLGSGGIYDGGPIRSSEYTQNQIGVSYIGEPAQVYGIPTNKAYVYNNANFGSAGSIEITEIVNPLSSPSFLQHHINFSVPASNVFVAPGQPGTTQTIEVNGTNAVWRDGFLYIVEIYRPASGPNKDVATTHWFKISTDAWTLVDHGDVSGAALGPGVATFDSTIAVNANGDFAINFTASGPSLYPGSYYSLHRASDPVGTLEDPQPLHAGLDSYVSLESTRNRWGDYQRAIIVDPVDDASFWMFNEFALTRDPVTGNGRYGTVVGAFSTTSAGVPPPGGRVDIGSHGVAWPVSGVGDFNSDGHSDVLWRSPSTGQVDQWQMTNGHWSRSIDLGANKPANWLLAGVGDFDGDGTSDIVWRDISDSQVDQWHMKNGNWAGSIDHGKNKGADWTLAGVGDFNGDGVSDILWRKAQTSQVDQWEMKNGNWSRSIDLGANKGSEWSLAGVGDFNGDGITDVLWRNVNTSQVDQWQMKNGNWSRSIDLGASKGADWIVAGIGDFNADHTDDILWFNTKSGQLEYWAMANGNWAGSINLGAHTLIWQSAGIGDFNHDGASDALWLNAANGHLIEQLLMA